MAPDQALVVTAKAQRHAASERGVVAITAGAMGKQRCRHAEAVHLPLNTRRCGIALKELLKPKAQATQQLNFQRIFGPVTHHRMAVKMKNASDAAATTAVAVHPQSVIDHDKVNRPITLGLRTINIITAISGAASTPLITAAQ